MKWFFILTVIGGTAISDPFETQEQCVIALRAAIEQEPFLRTQDGDVKFPTRGYCLQGEPLG